MIRDDDVPGLLLQGAPQSGSGVNPPDLGSKTTALELPEDQLTIILAVFNHENAQRLANAGGR